jgi:hypothetical protein
VSTAAPAGAGAAAGGGCGGVVSLVVMVGWWAAARGGGWHRRRGWFDPGPTRFCVPGRSRRVPPKDLEGWRAFCDLKDRVRDRLTGTCGWGRAPTKLEIERRLGDDPFAVKAKFEWSMAASRAPAWTAGGTRRGEWSLSCLPTPRFVGALSRKSPYALG